jgi:GH24 family phage-related lysozyme (muramidase)
MKTSQAGVDLIKEFEGLRLDSYYCASQILTIGYGHTGPDVWVGQVITEQEAEKLLRDDLEIFEQAVSELIDIDLTQNQFDALVSFTFNCGDGALEQSSLRRRLNKGEDPNTVAEEELPRWNKGANGPLAGLTRRREAEVKLFTLDSRVVELCTNKNTWFKKEPIDSVKLKNDQKSKVVKERCYKGCKIIKSEDKHTLVELPYNLGTWWIFNEHWDGLAENKENSKNNLGYKVLNVPYQSQRDNYTQWWRTCFSSSCAMALMYLKPDAVSGDDQYLSQVLKNGDTTSSTVQVETLEHFGLNASFRQDGTLSKLKGLISSGVPVPIGILHKGPSYAPQGGGHWICVIGYNEDNKAPGGGYFVVHDPYGELENNNGQYSSTNGQSLNYSLKMIEQRWTCEGPGSGWYIDLSNN